MAKIIHNGAMTLVDDTIIDANATPESSNILPTPEERIQRLEETKAEQSDVDELHEALDMILEGVTE